MSAFRILTEWEDPKRAKGPELRATWASLKIECAAGENPEVITRWFDNSFNTLRLQIFGPMYPLAEWIAFHWFQILYGTDRQPEQAQDIRFGAEGYALPRLSFCSEGDQVRLRWNPYTHHGAKVEFLGEGDQVIPRPIVENELAGFVFRTIARLNEYDIENTPLQLEWRSILELEQEEREFCIAAASLGLDPFTVPDETAGRIARVGGLLSNDVQVEFFPVATSETVLEEAEAVLAVIQKLEATQRENHLLEELRQSMGTGDRTRDPWMVGYEIARRTRSMLGIPGGPLSLDTLVSLGEPLPVAELGGMPRIDGIVSTNCTASASAVHPDFAQRRVENQKFSAARLLCERLTLPSSSTGLVTRERTARQKLNRAFAAELLAPAHELRHRITQQQIDREELQDLAEEFEVSSFVIENQVKNHRLAKVQGSWF